MNLFHGYTGRRLQDRDGQVSYAFIHEGGAIFELRGTQKAATGLENKRVIVKGRLISATTVLADEIQIDVSSPKASFLSHWTQKASAIIALAIPWLRH